MMMLMMMKIRSIDHDVDDDNHDDDDNVVVGLSGVGGLFTDEVLTAMGDNCDTPPVIFPLSNPTSRSIVFFYFFSGELNTTADDLGC